MTNEEFATLIAGYSPTAQKDTLQEKIDKLNQRTAEKVAKLGDTSKYSKDTLQGLYDADTAITKNLGYSREVDPYGNRYDAVETQHGTNPYDMQGISKERRAAGEIGKSTYSMQMQRNQVGMILNKPVDTVTEQDMLDVANQQQIQKLADLARTPGEDRWVAPLIRGVEQTNLTGKYKDEFGNTQQVPLNVPIISQKLGDIGSRGGAALGNLYGEEVTVQATIDPLQNAFAGKVKNSRSDNNTPTKEALAKYIQEQEANAPYWENAAKSVAATIGATAADVADGFFDAGANLAQKTARAFGGDITKEDLPNLSKLGFQVDSDGQVRHYWGYEKDGKTSKQAFNTLIGANDVKYQKITEDFNNSMDGIWGSNEPIYTKVANTLKEVYNHKEAIPQAIADSLSYMYALGKQPMAMLAGATNQHLDERLKVTGEAADLKTTLAVAGGTAVELGADFVAAKLSFGVGKGLGGVNKKVIDIMFKALPIKAGESIVAKTIGAIVKSSTKLAAAGTEEFSTESFQEVLGMLIERVGTTKYDGKKVWGLLDEASQKAIRHAGYQGLLIGIGQSVAGSTPGVVINAAPKVFNAGKTAVERATETPVQKRLREDREYVTPLKVKTIDTIIAGDTENVVSQVEAIHGKMVDNLDASASKKTTYGVIIKEALDKATKSGDATAIDNVYKTIAKLDKDEKVDFNLKDMVDETVYESSRKLVEAINQNTDVSSEKLKDLGEAVNEKTGIQETIVSQIKEIQDTIDATEAAVKSIRGSEDIGDTTESITKLKNTIKNYLENKDSTAVNSEFADLGFIVSESGNNLHADPNRPGLTVYENELTKKMLNPKAKAAAVIEAKGTTAVTLKGLTGFAASRLRKLRATKNKVAYQTDVLIGTLAKENGAMLVTIKNLLKTAKGLKSISETDRKSYEAELETAGNAALEANKELERRQKILNETTKPKGIKGALAFQVETDGSESIQLVAGENKTKIGDVVDNKAVLMDEYKNSEKVASVTEKTEVKFKVIKNVKKMTVKELEEYKNALTEAAINANGKERKRLRSIYVTVTNRETTMLNDQKYKDTTYVKDVERIKKEKREAEIARSEKLKANQKSADVGVPVKPTKTEVKETQDLSNLTKKQQEFVTRYAAGELKLTPGQTKRYNELIEKAKQPKKVAKPKGSLESTTKQQRMKEASEVKMGQSEDEPKQEVKKIMNEKGFDSDYKNMSEEDIAELTRLEEERLIQEPVEATIDDGVLPEQVESDNGPLSEVRAKIEFVNKELSALIDGVKDMNVKKHVKEYYAKKLGDLQEDRTRLGKMLDRLETALDKRMNRKYDTEAKSILAGLVAQIDKLVKQMIKQINRLDKMLKKTNKQYRKVNAELQTILDAINAIEAEFTSEPVKTTIGTITKIDEELYGTPVVDVNGERVIAKRQLKKDGKLEAPGTAMNRALELVKNDKIAELRDELKEIEAGKTSLSAKLIGRLLINYPANSPIHRLVKRANDSVFGQLTGNPFAKADRLLEVLPKGFKEFFITDAESKVELLENFKTMADYLNNTKIGTIIVGNNTLSKNIDNNGLVIKHINKYVPIKKVVVKGDKLQDADKQAYIVESADGDKVHVKTSGRNPVKSIKQVSEFTGVLEQQETSAPVDIIELLGTTKDGKLQIDEQTKNILKFFTAKMLADSQAMIGKILSFDESEMAQYLGITDPDEQIRVKQEAAQGYVNSASIRKDIGGEVYQALGIRLNETTPEFTEESFKSTLGVLVQVIATENGSMDGKPLEAGGKNQNLIKTNWENIGVERGALTKAINKLQYLNENRNRPLPSLKAPKDNANRTVMNTKNPMDAKSVEFLNNTEKTAYKISPRLQRWLEMDEKEALKAMGYVDVDTAGLHVSEIDAQRARNDKLVREWEILKTFAKATKGKEFYLDWGQTVSGRYTILNDIQYQESKLHREFVVAEGSTESVDVNDADSRQMLEASIMQGLDMDPDKLSAETATANFNDVFKVTDKGIEIEPQLDKDGDPNKTQVAIKQAYEALRDGKIDAEAMAEVFADSEGHHGISSIELLVDWDQAIKDGTKIETHANLEIDAITSGMILTLLQIGSDLALRLAEKGGIYTEARKPQLEAYVKKWLGDTVEFTPGALIEAGKKHAAEIEEKMKGLSGEKLAELRKELESDDTFKDLYSTIGVAMIGEVQAYKTKLEGLDKPSELEIQQLAMLNQIGELNLKNIRSIAKSPVMVYIYGASISSIKKKLTYSLGVNTLVKAIKTASKKLKAGENADKELEFVKTFIPKEKYVNEFGAKVETPSERWEQLLALDIQPAIDTIDSVIKETFGTAIETAFDSRLGFVNKNRDAAKAIEMLVFEAYQIRLADEVNKFLDAKYGKGRHKGETYRLSKEDMQSINAKLTAEGHGHNIVWDETEGRVNQSLNKTGDKGGIHSTKVTVGNTSVGGQIKQFKPAVNTGAAPTISIHAIDGRMMLDVLNRELGGKYAGGNVYDAVVLSLDKAMLTDTADSYNTNMIETGFNRSIVADQLGMLENMLATMDEKQKKRMFANIGLRPEGELREDYTNETNRIGLGIGKMLDSLETAEEVNKERLANSAKGYYSGHLFQMGSGIAKIDASETRAKEFPAIETIKRLLQNKLAADRKVTKKEFANKGIKLNANTDYVFNLSDIANKKTQVESKANIAQISEKSDGKLKVDNKLWDLLSANDTVEIIGEYSESKKKDSQSWHYNNITNKLANSDAKIVTKIDLTKFGRELVNGVWVKSDIKSISNDTKETAVESSNRPIFDSLPSYQKGQNTMTYAGIGSRQTSKETLILMTKVAAWLAKKGYKLQTGKTFGNKEEGADKAFSDGTTNKELFGPEMATEKTKAIAKELHPAPQYLREGGLKLMARNTNQVFGKNLDTPVDFVLFNSEETKNPMRPKGGTGQAVEMARVKGIPTINMMDKDWRKQLEAVINKSKETAKQEEVIIAPSEVFNKNVNKKIECKD